MAASTVTTNCTIYAYENNSIYLFVQYFTATIWSLHFLPNKSPKRSSKLSKWNYFWLYYRPSSLEQLPLIIKKLRNCWKENQEPMKVWVRWGYLLSKWSPFWAVMIKIFVDVGISWWFGARMYWRRLWYSRVSWSLWQPSRLEPTIVEIQ